MSNWMNEAGEPYMTHAQLAFEASLDEQAAYERAYDYDDYGYDSGEGVAPEDCTHGDASSRADGRWFCDICDEEILDLVTDEDGETWPAHTV